MALAEINRFPKPLARLAGFRALMAVIRLILPRARNSRA
jgi:hypothetical protein